MHAALLLAYTIGAAAASPLFVRQSGGYPAPNTVGPTPKAEWVAAYNKARSAGKIPSFAPSKLVNGNAAYAAGVDLSSSGVCSWTLAHCFGDGDVYNAPAGMYAIAFDDGPLPSSPRLYDFLQQNNQTATHFTIGSNILNNQQVFEQALQSGGHIGVHTWSHPYMTTLDDMAVLGELGWTAQIIHDYSGFVPKWWRPPYGDADNRVRAIAKEVFGMTLAGWDVDSNDWCLSEGGGSSCHGYGPQSDSDLIGELQGWQAGSKAHGVLGLEHELTTRSVSAFIDTFSGIAAKGWDARSIPDLFGADWYLNAKRNEAPNTAVQIGTGTAPNSTSSSLSSSSSTSTSSALSSSNSTTMASVYTTTRLPTPTSIGETVTAQSQVVTASTAPSNSALGRLAPSDIAVVALFLALGTVMV